MFLKSLSNVYECVFLVSKCLKYVRRTNIRPVKNGLDGVQLIPPKLCGVEKISLRCWLNVFTTS